MPAKSRDGSVPSSADAAPARAHTAATGLLIALALVVPVGATEVLAAKIYFTDNDTQGTSGWVRRADLDGANVQTLLETELGAFALDLDLEAPKVYWYQDWLDPDVHPSPSVRRANTDGTDQETLFDWSRTSDIAVDSAGGKIYVTSVGVAGGGFLDRWNLGGSGHENLALLDFIPNGLALDLDADKVYLAGPSHVWRTNLDGTGLEQVLPVDSAALRVAVDPAALALYWTTPTGLYRGNTDGTGSERLVASVGAYALALDLLNGTVYWSETRFTGGGRILRANLDGSAVEPIIVDVQCYGMAAEPLGVADVPAVSAWGSVALGLLLVSASTLILLRRRWSETAR